MISLESFFAFLVSAPVLGVHVVVVVVVVIVVGSTMIEKGCWRLRCDTIGR
jgi:hypothetical protein